MCNRNNIEFCLTSKGMLKRLQQLLCSAGAEAQRRTTEQAPYLLGVCCPHCGEKLFSCPLHGPAVVRREYDAL